LSDRFHGASQATGARPWAPSAPPEAGDLRSRGVRFAKRRRDGSDRVTDPAGPECPDSGRTLLAARHPTPRPRTFAPEPEGRIRCWDRAAV